MAWICKFRFNLLIVAILLGGAQYTYGNPYEIKQKDGYFAYAITIDPKDYSIGLEKSFPIVNGRERVSSIGNRLKADIAINGGFFKIGHGVDGLPSGSLVVKGKIYQIKDKIQPLVIIDSGKLQIGMINPHEYLEKNGSGDISMVSGTPLLINNGKIVLEVLKKQDEAYTKPRARTSLGIKGNGEVVIFVSEGSSLLGLAQSMQELGCRFAINLDGGGSSVLWMDGKIINKMVGDEDEREGLLIERPVSDAFVFMRKVQD